MYLVKMRTLNYDNGGKLISLELVPDPVGTGLYSPVLVVPLPPCPPLTPSGH